MEERDFTLNTERLCLRRFRESDWADLFEYLSDPGTVRYEPYDAYTANGCKKLAKSRVTDPAFIAICLGSSSGKMIGNLYFQLSEFNSYEIGYIINPEYRNKGYAFEASSALIDYAFRVLAAEEVFAMCCVENTASYMLMQKLGMSFVKRHENHSFFGKRHFGLKVYEDVFEYRLSYPDYVFRNSRHKSIEN